MLKIASKISKMATICLKISRITSNLLKVSHTHTHTHKKKKKKKKCAILVVSSICICAFEFLSLVFKCTEMNI